MFVKTFTACLKCNSRLMVNKRLRWSSASIQLFADLYDMSLKDGKKYRLEMKIPPLNEERLQSTAAFRESIGISKQEWLKHPILLKELAETLGQQYSQLKEGGFAKVNANVLAHYRKCVRQKISILKLHNFIPAHINVAENFMTYLNPRPSDLQINDLTDDHIFEHIHHSILTRYLMWRFETTQDVIEKFYRVYTFSKLKSFHNLCQNFAIAEQLGFSPKKLLKYGYLLTVYPKNTKRVLAEMPIVAGMDIRRAMRLYPKLIGISPEHYTEIYDYLKKENVSDETIKKCMNIFSLSLKTVKLRFQEIKEVPELRVLFNNPLFLKLIIHHNQARSRLSFLKQLNLQCATTAVLADHTNYNMYIKEGKDCNSSNEILLLLKRLLKTESPLLDKNLRKHRYYRHVPLVEVERSFKLLKQLKFTNRSILDVIQVLLYPSCKIKEACIKIRENKSLREQKLDLTEKLNLILYFIEKEHHFTGNGIWKDDDKHN